MPHKTKLLYLLVFFLVNPVLAVEPVSTGGHKITKLKITTPTKEDPVRVGQSTSVEARFILKSPSGFDTSRLRAYFNQVNGTPLTGNFNFNGETLNEEQKTVLTKFKTTQARQINSERTEVIFQYLLTSTQIQDEPPLAQRSKIIVSRPAPNTNENNDDGGNNSNGSGSEGGGGNGDPSIVEQAFYLSVTENGSTDIGGVSLNPKQFILSVTHDADLISGVSDTGNGSIFVPELDPIIKRLKVKSRKKTIGDDGKSSKEVNDLDFEWSLKSASTASADIENYLLTKYISNGKVLSEVQRLRFVVNLAKHFERNQTDIGDDVIVKDAAKYKINALNLNVSNIEITPTTLDFQQDELNAKRGKQQLELDEGFLVNGIVTTTNLDLSETVFKSIDFGKSRIKLANAKTKQRIKPSLGIGDFSIETIEIDNGNNGTYHIEIPLTSSITTNKTVFTKRKKKLATNGVDKKIIIPFSINALSQAENGLELKFSGTVEEEVIINIETTDGTINPHSEPNDDEPEEEETDDSDNNNGDTMSENGNSMNGDTMNGLILGL